MVFPSLYSRHRAVIGSLGRDLVPRHLFWKLVVCTPAFRVQKAGRNGRIWSEGGFSLADRTASVWLCSKFGAGGDGSGRNRLYAAAVEEAGENNCSATELLRVSSEFPDPKPRAIGRAGASSKASRCWLSVNVSHVSVEGEAIYPLKVNSEAVSSGTQAVLFQFRGFDCGSDVEDDENDCVTDLERSWWEYERERLYSLLSTLPIGSKVPLLLAFVPTEI
ncbi:hypothetical protein BDR26DRAFT_524225 [Obelidium mucronatum]|nr:hypothetical protein BDR26DRAFT_524225 [Obelidium mucronatum]